jgi:curli biogenesis system outer membrane secretion channel CsgG
MKKNGIFALLMCWFGAILTGCVTPGTEAEVKEGQESPTIAEVQAEAYDGPKARVAVAQFKDKTGKGWWTSQIGDGMADQMTTALFNTNRFIVLERQALGHVISEQDLGASGRVRQDTAAPIGEIEGAELLIVGAVTEFEGAASGTQGGIGGIGKGILGALGGGYKRAHMAIDVRIVDTRTSRILAATSVEGEATDVNLSGLIGGYGGSGALASGLGGWKNTPTEKALRICIKKAVDFIATKTPQKYYHHGGVSSPPSVTPSPEAPSAGRGMVEISANSLRVRNGPGTQFSVITSVKRGSRFPVLEMQNGWLRIQMPSGAQGWVSEKYTRPAR